jgi:muramoyltetrapeptide carboxypeptidase
LEGWGLQVEIAPHAFDAAGYLAGSDDDRLADLTNALLDPAVRAVLATRGGKGSYRIAHRLPFERIRADPKPVVGFSDITALHLMLGRMCGALGVHGALTADAEDSVSEVAAASLHSVLTGNEPVVVEADPSIASADITTSGIARGPLLGGNLDMIATSAGWALPSLRGAILMIESAGHGIGHLDRALTMLVQAGHLQEVAGFAVGHVDVNASPSPKVMALLREHLQDFGVPILGGLPIGHHADGRSVLIGADTTIDTAAGTLTQFRIESSPGN